MKGIKTAGLCIVIVLLVFIFAAGSMATNASISGSGTEGLVTITASAAFSTYEYCDDADPPNCTTCDSGNMWVTREGTGHCHGSGNGSASCTFTVNAGLMPQGDHVFMVHIKDCDGLSVDEFYTLQIDNTPQLTVGNVDESEGWIDPSGSVGFKDNPNGNDGSVHVMLDGDPRGYKYYEDAADWSWKDVADRAIIPASLSNGQHFLKIEARAANGAAVAQNFPLNIDNTPTIDINEIKEINGSFDVGGKVAFKVHPTTYDGTVAVYFDGARHASAWVEESSWSYFRIASRLIDPTVLTTGPHTIKVIATAANQTKTEAQTTFYVDNTPKVSIDEIGKLEGLFDITGKVEFQEATSMADGSLSVYLDDGLLAVRNMEESSWSYSELVGRQINASMLSNGDHSVRLVARARNGEQDSARITFTIDNTPQITLNGLKQPEGQFDVTGQVTFKENPQSFEGYIKYYLNDIYLSGRYYDSTDVSIKFSDFNGKLFNASKMDEGDYTFKVVADARNGATVTSSVTANIAKIDPLQNQGAANGDCRTDTKVKTVTFTSNPINFATGNKYKRQTDIVLGGPGLLLSFIRHYNSQFEFDGAFGHGWTGSYSDNISVSADSIILRQSDGRYVHFVDDGSGRYLTATDRVRTFEAHSDGYTLTEPGGIKKTFDSSGLLIRIEDANGNTQSISRTDGNISSVSDDFGQTLNFQYNSDSRLSVLTTPVGSFTYSYDALGNLVRVDNPDATFKAYIYDDPNDSHNLTGITDENGIRSLTVTYDDQDRALTSALAGGAERVRVGYHNHFQRSVTDSLGNNTTFQLHVSKGIARVESSVGSGCSSCLASLEESYELNDRLLIDSTIDAEENRTDYTYDDRGRMLTKTEAAGTAHERTTDYSWHPELDKITAVTRSSVAHAGQTTTTSFEYDTAGNLLTVSSAGFDGTDPVGRTISYTYNANGQVLTADGPRSDVADVITFDYYPNDAGEGLNRGRLHQITNSLGQQTLYADYNAWGRPQRITDINGIVTSIEFDGAGRIEASTRNEKTTGYAYDGIGHLLAVTLPSGRLIRYGYTDAGFVETITDNAGSYIQYAYDSEGNRTLEQIHDVGGRLARYTEFGFDEYNRLANVYYPDGDFEDYYWDKNGNLTAMVDAAGQTVSRAYDALNRLELLTQPGEIKTQYAYDAHDNLTRVTDAEEHQTLYSFNDLGDRVAEDSPDSGLTVYTYNPAGNLVSKTDANQVTVSYAYDALNRLIGIDYPDEAQNVTYRYDEGEYGIGRLSAMIDAGGSYEYRYEADGNLAAELRIIDGRLYTTEYRYDPTGILTGITYPNGRQVAYELDEAGRVTRVTTTFGGVTSVVADNLSYLPFGPLSGYDAGGTTRIDKAFDTRYRLTGITAGALLDLDYEMDPVGNVTQINDSLDPDRNATYGYDDLYRLTSATGVYGAIGYTYDDVGNRLTRTHNGQTDTYQYLAGTNRLEQIGGQNPQSFTYDAAGNPTSSGTKSFVYNQNNRLIRVSENNAVTGQYVYSASGQRIKKTTADGSLIFHYDQAGNIIGESTPAGDFSAVYIYLGSQRLAVVAATPLNEIGITVATSEGRLLEGLNVYAFTEAGAYTGHKAVTDAAGRAVFDPAGLAEGGYRFRADYLGDRFWSNPISLPDTVSADIVIDEAPVTVQITQAGAANAGIKVYLFNESEKYLGLYANTDENGEVTFVLPAGRSYKFRADVLGSRFMSETFTVQPGAGNAFQVATGGGRLTVHLQKQDATPLSGVNMYLFNTDSRYLGLKVQSDPAGQVYFDVPAGSYRVRADYLGHRFWTADLAVTADRTADLTIAHADVTVAIEGDWDGDMRPLEALPVYLFSAADKYLGIKQTTDNLGQVVFNLPAEDFKVRVDCQKQRYWSEVFNHEDQTVTIAEALADVTVSGQGLPLTGVKVFAFNDAGAYLGLNDVTDSAGQVSFRLPAGDYDFRADYLDSRYFAGPTPLIAHVANPVAISTGGANLALTLQKQPQSPLAGVSCYLFSAAGKYLAQRQVTGGAGEAQFNLADGDYKIRVDYLGYRYWTEEISIPATSSLVFEIPHQDVTVTVSGDYDGDVQPLADIPVYLFNAAEKYMKISGRTNALGQVVFNLPEAEYLVRADYLKERYWSEVFAAADTDITIEEGMAAVAVSQAGRPLEGVKVYAFSAADSYLGLSGATDADGLVEFRLPQGTYRFRADHQGSRFWATARVEGHVVNNIDLATGGGTFVLSLQKDTGEALSGIPVYVFSDAGKYLGINATTDETGQAAFELADGTYRFRVDYLGYRFWSTDLTVPDVLSDVLAIDHQDVTVTVNEVYGYDTTPIENIPVYLFTAGGSYQRVNAKTDKNGQVVFNLPLADHEVRADYLSGRFWSPVFNGTDVVVDIGHGLAAVHVTDAELDLFDVPVYLFNEAGKYLGWVERTDSAGMATFPVPEGNYKFRVDYDGNQLWSDEVSILADEQNDIEMDAAMLLSDLTTDPSPVRFDGTSPVYEPQQMMVAGLGSLTGILPALITGQTSVDQIYFYINDHLGTPQVVVDEAGEVVWTANYEPFGDVEVGSGSKADNNFRFSGQYYDEETGLHYNYHRYYDPQTGRYLTPDPIGLLGGVNLYVYANLNPINRIDPYGLAPEDAIAVWQGFVTNPNSLQYGVARPKSMWDPTPVYSLPFTEQFKLRLLYQDSIGIDVTAYTDEQLACEYRSEVHDQLGLVSAAGGFLTGGGNAGPKGTLGNTGRPYNHSYKYHPRIRARGVEDPKGHNFSYSYDDYILSSAPVKQADGSLLYRVPGSLNGRNGYYEIAINPTTKTIFHRTFNHR